MAYSLSLLSDLLVLALLCMYHILAVRRYMERVERLDADGNVLQA